MNDLEGLILKSLCENEDFARKTLPYLEQKYFSESNGIVFSEIHKFWNKFNSKPAINSLLIEISNRKDITEDSFKEIKNNLVSLQKNKDPIDLDWLLVSTETFCQDNALSLAILDSYHIAEGKNKKLSKTAIPEILSKALAVTFDSNVGHDYFKDAEARYDLYEKKTKKYPTHLETINMITQGGFEEKTINVISALTGVGKTALMIDFAAHYMFSGQNVLYITLEMAEEKIAERIDANLMDIAMQDIKLLGKDKFLKKVDRIKEKTVGKLIVKEYPIGSAHTGHFRFLLRELKQKQGFIPKIIIVDYLNICASAHFKKGSTNSYEYIKSIAEELRSLAQEEKIVLITATQLNRDAVGSNDPDESNVSESFGGPMTFDWFVALIRTEELIKLGHVCLKQFKSRYSDKSQALKSMLGFDPLKMKFFDLNQSTNTNVTQKPNQNKTVVTNTNQKNLNKFNSQKTKFTGFKI